MLVPHDVVPVAQARQRGLGGSQGAGAAVFPATRAPRAYCATCTGIDNAFATLSWLFNPEFIKAVTAGDYALLLEHEDLKTGGVPYELNLFWGERIDPVACDPATAGCNYGVYPSDLISPCDPRWMVISCRRWARPAARWWAACWNTFTPRC